MEENTQPNLKQVAVRASDEEHARWKAAAERQGLTLSDYVRNAVNGATAEVLDCQHPESARKTYPWASFCLKCGIRLSG